jgi:hypothetical protein
MLLMVMFEGGQANVRTIALAIVGCITLLLHIATTYRPTVIVILGENDVLYSSLDD